MSMTDIMHQINAAEHRELRMTASRSAIKVFISYAHADREIVASLVTRLEREGFDVWWDRKSENDAFRDEIEERLAAADVACVVWTKTSVTRPYVKAEAGRAHALDKLVMVGDGSIGPKQIPLPFNDLKLYSTDDASAAILKKARRNMSGEHGREIVPGVAGSF